MDAAPVIVARSAWLCAGPPPRRPAELGRVECAVVHHTAMAGGIAAVHHLHQVEHGWDDIGYNLLVDAAGRVYEGRAGGVERAVVGAHAQGWNSVSVGVACIGNFGAESLPGPGLDALARVIAWKLSMHGAPVEGRVALTSAGGAANRYPKDEEVEFERISGHRDGDQTECPGGALYGALAQLRSRARAIAPSPPSTAPNPLTIARAAARVAVGAHARVSGKAPPGSTVRVSLERRTAGRLTRAGAVMSVRARSDGRWTARPLLTRAGLHRITARVGASERGVYVRAVGEASGGVRAG